MPGAKKVGYAVVGLGLIARNSVLPAFAHSKRAKLVALISSDPKKAAEFRAKYRAACSYSTKQYDTCLANPEVTAVYIATPQGAHEEFAVRAAAAGKQVLCEKPLAATPEQSARMVDACQRHGVLLMTAYRKYFEASTVHLKSLIGKGVFGRIDTIHTTFSERFVPGTSQSWLLDPALSGGGPLTDLGVYCVNTSRWLVDEDPIEAAAESWRDRTDLFQQVEEGITFRLSFPSGLRVLGSSTYSSAMSSFLFVQGSKGWALLTPAYPYDAVQILSGSVAGKAFQKRFPPSDEFALELDAFADAILNRKNVEPDGVQGHRDVIIIHSIYESAKTGRPVSIQY